MRPSSKESPSIIGTQVGCPPAFPKYTLNTLYDDGTADVIEIGKRLASHLKKLGYPSEG